MRKEALEGLKVVEYGNFISAPFCAKLLADMGAEVIKVEEPGCGDQSRRSEPFFKDIPDDDGSGLFLYLNINKYGVTIDPKNALGAKMFQRLIKDADILVENWPPAIAKKMGIDYKTLSKINPQLIVTSITPFGQTGPWRNYKATELISFHAGGIGSRTPGGVTDPLKEPPLKAAGHQAEFMGGVVGATATMVAVFAREMSGKGQHVDVSVQEAVASTTFGDIANWTYERKVTPRTTEFGMVGGGGLIPCRDGYITVLGNQDYQWASLVEVMGNPEWAKDPRFGDFISRIERWSELKPLIMQYTMQHTKEEVYKAFQAKRVPCYAVNKIDEVVKSEQLAFREFFKEIDHPKVGKLRYPTVPYHFSATPAQIRKRAPLLGEDNAAIFGKLGYSKEDLVKIREAGAI